VSRRLRVQLIHGLEGSPTGAKAQVLARHFELLAPAMDTSDFEGAIRTQADALAVFCPDVLVGSSFGGAVALALVQRGSWRGPTLLLAPAHGHFGLESSVPAGATLRIVHGTRDDVCPIEHSRALARSPSVELVEVDDDHRLSSLLAGGALAGWVRGLGERGNRG
jgi:predicted esterase